MDREACLPGHLKPDATDHPPVRFHPPSSRVTSQLLRSLLAPVPKSRSLIHLEKGRRARFCVAFGEAGVAVGGFVVLYGAGEGAFVANEQLGNIVARTIKGRWVQPLFDFVQTTFQQGALRRR
jgi:hypothetical protein